MHGLEVELELEARRDLKRKLNASKQGCENVKLLFDEDAAVTLRLSD